MLVALSARVSTLLREVTGLEVISKDKVEGVDSKRPCFFVDVTLLNASPRMHYYADNRLQVSVDYFGRNSLDLSKMCEQLEGIFALHVACNGLVLMVENKEAYCTPLNVLRFSFETSFRTALNPLHLTLATGEVAHVTDYADELIGSVLIKEG